jgi:hypothetical protein
VVDNADGPRMRSVKDCLGLKDDEIQKQIEMRRDLIKTMVGTLYPGIVQEEIAVLWHFKGLNTLERMALIDDVK